MAYISPQPSQGTVTGITYYLMQKEQAPVRNIEKAPRVTHRSVITQMASRLASSVYRNLSPSKKKKISPSRLAAVALQYLQKGLSVDETAEKLHSVEY